MGRANCQLHSLIDRIKKMYATIKAIDLALVGVLKKLFKPDLRLLLSALNLPPRPNDWTLLSLLKTKLREWKIDNEIMNKPATTTSGESPFYSS